VYKVAETYCNLENLRSVQEESDTKIILYATHAAERDATTLRIFAQDADILVLALRRYPRIPIKSYFGSSQQTTN
jgi:inosine/xanthosine triphosphate pyrophosphatase family protein